MEKNDVLFQSICDGRYDQVTSALEEKLKEGADAIKMLNGSMIPAMREVGERFSRNEIFIPEMLVSARAMQTGLKVIEPHLMKEGHKPKGTLAIGTVEGDLHDIGKNIVVIMLKSAGYNVVDLGIDVKLERFEKAIKDGAQVILASALLTTTMPKMKEVVEFCNKNYPDIKTVVGGAPVTESFAKEINADAYGEDAGAAPKIIDGFFK